MCELLLALASRRREGANGRHIDRSAGNWRQLAGVSRAASSIIQLDSGIMEESDRGCS